MLSEEQAEDAIIEYIDEQITRTIPTWLYIFVFTVPAITTYSIMQLYLGVDTLLSAVTSLAVMNGSINSIIAWLTIRLDGQSSEALDHLDSPNLGKINPRVLPILQEARAKDLSFVLDSLDDIEVSIPEFAGKLDRERFAVAGHSFGGMISEVMVGAPITRPDGEVVSYADERFDAAVIISGVGPATMVDKSRLTEAAFDSINRPLFASGGTLDTGNVGTREQFPWEWRMSPYTLSPPEDKYSLVLENGDHYLGGEICRPNRGGDNDPQGVEIVRVLNTAFLDAYVKNDSAAKEFLRTVDVSSITSGRAALEYK